jgi:hypothetical protein
MMSDYTDITRTAGYLAGRRYQREQLELKLNNRIASFRYSEGVAARLNDVGRQRLYAAKRQALEDFLINDLGGRLKV